MYCLSSIGNEHQTIPKTLVCEFRYSGYGIMCGDALTGY